MPGQDNHFFASNGFTSHHLFAFNLFKNHRLWNKLVLRNYPLSHQMSAHQRYVKQLYKRSLRLANDWYWQRAEFREKAIMIRGMFEANKDLSNPKEIEAVLLQTEHTLASYMHHNPYLGKFI